MTRPSASKSFLGRTTSYPVSTSIELISRGPDGHFLISPYKNDTPGSRSKKLTGVRRSVSLHSESLEKTKPPFVLSVDLPPCNLTEIVPSRQFGSTAQHLPNHESKTGGDLPGLCSDGSSATFPDKDSKHTLTFPVLPHIRHGLGQPATNASVLVLQMEHERERGNLNHCLKLAQEREELEKELQRYTLERSSTRQQHLGLERQGTGDSELLWEYKSRTLPRRYPQGNKQRSALSSSSFSTASLGWEARGPDFICANTSLSPVLSSAAEPRLQCGEAGGGSTDRWTLPHRSSKKHRKAEAAPRSYDSSAENGHGHGSISTLSLHSNRYADRSNSTLGVARSSRVLFPEALDEKASVEMSVDEPQLEGSIMAPSSLMLHHRISSHLQQGPANGTWYEDMSSKRFDSTFGGAAVRPTAPDPRLELSRVQSSKIWESVLRSRSLDMRRQKEEEEFLTPDAWINSLSQENCSLLSSDHPSSTILEKQVLSTRTIAKSPTNFPSTSQPPPLVHSLSPEESSERLTSMNNASLNSGCKINERGHREAFAETQGPSEVTNNTSECVREDNHLDALEIVAASYEEVPQSGSYSSYASSGRGSMGPANGRLSVCHPPSSLTTSPVTVGKSQGTTPGDAPTRYLCRHKNSLWEVNLLFFN